MRRPRPALRLVRATDADPEVVGYDRRGRDRLMNQDQPVFENDPLNATGCGDSSVHRGREATQDAFPCKAAERPFGLYVHIPYCEIKCPYCDFYTYPLQKPAETERYVRAVCREIGRLPKGKIDTLYFGGGTPSLLSPDQLQKISTTVRSRLSVAPNAEVTLEINPETVTAENAAAWHSLGINRASLGVQSLDHRELIRLKRAHLASDSRKGFDILRSAGFSNISLDLIYGLEGQDPKAWESTLREIVSWNPEHISAYNLTIEGKTRFAVEVRQGSLRLPPEDDQIAMFGSAREILSSAGFISYEISNHAKPGFESRHNLIYWTGGNYWGVGVSAHSFRRRDACIERWWNVRSFPKYIEALENKRDPREEGEILSKEQHWNERLITGLRLTTGVDLNELENDLGIHPSSRFDATIAGLVKTSHLERQGSRISLSEKGILLSEEIFTQLLR